MSDQSARRLRMVIAFDGSAFHGWQSGRSGRGVADHLSQVLAETLGVSSELVSSSRTDSGVHAYGLVAHADVSGKYASRTPEAIRSLLNAHLPAAIRVREAAWVTDAFHARFSAVSKEYRYRLWNEAVMHPLMANQAWHVPKPLDLKAMKAAASLLVGRHDFKAFTSKRDGELGSSQRQMIQLGITRRGAEWIITLRADGYLYKMCRGVVGTLVEVGLGKMSLEQVAALLRSPKQRTPAVNAPAHGLVLWKVHYR